MPIDISLQFNGHNSYKALEAFRSHPFGVQNMNWITISLQAMATTELAEAVRAETRFYDSNGMFLSKVSHSFAVGTTWDKVVITVAVPETAVKAQVAMLPGPAVWWWVEAKAEEGQTATPYNINYAGQLTKLTPTGVYTGLLNVDQVLVRGTQANPEELLGERLVTIANNHITLSNYVNGRTTKITAEGVYTGEIEADQIKGGVIRAASPVTFGPFTQADRNRVMDSLSGVITLSEVERRKYDINMDGRVSNTDAIMISRMLSGEEPNPWTRIPTVRIEPPSGSFEGGIFFGVGDDVGPTTSGFYMSRGKFAGREFDVFEGKLSTLTAYQIISDRGGGGIMLNAGELLARSPSGSYNVHLTNSKAQMNGPWSTNGENAWGVDSGGPYFIKNGTKKYATL